MTNQKQDNVRRAIAITTAHWSDPAGSSQFTSDTVRGYLEDGQDTMDLLIGQISLTTFLLVKLEQAGEDSTEVLCDIASRYSGATGPII